MCITAYYYLKRRYMFLLARYHFLNHCSFIFLVKKVFLFLLVAQKKEGEVFQEGGPN